MMITTSCPLDGCTGTITYEDSKTHRAGRISGFCDQCAALFSLYGGVRRLESPGRQAAVA